MEKGLFIWQNFYDILAGNEKNLFAALNYKKDF